ncbi:MAG TPA: YitT family protein [Aromatoleum sp.]|uniref:YitT family protein n=1 Tax=Aromatoleum sp. TaxID=2307007 RepID=UPI002B4981C9|nr:YitT family protein [Aromatoleum sp.]HJV27928.1 YitT family protein [Aromatoleum sp.]
MAHPTADTTNIANANEIRHSALEDVQALLVGCLIVALSLVFFRETRLLTGGTTGLSFLVHYLAGWPLGAVLFALNLPFYLFAWRAMGRSFTLKTFCAVGLLSAFAEFVPRLISFDRLDPVFAAITAGLLAGVGILILIRHGASLGGIGVLAIYLQKRKGWRAGTVQMVADVAILSLGLLVVPLDKVLLSVLSAMALNLVIAVNHRPDRYFGF